MLNKRRGKEAFVYLGKGHSIFFFFFSIMKLFLDYARWAVLAYKLPAVKKRRKSIH